jgi:transcriptional regulator with XRE-family HTH domain
MNPETSAMLRVTPSRILQEEFLDGFKLSQAELAKRTGIPRSAINEIIKGKRSISADPIKGYANKLPIIRQPATGSGTWNRNSGISRRAGILPA